MSNSWKIKSVLSILFVLSTALSFGQAKWPFQPLWFQGHGMGGPSETLRPYVSPDGATTIYSNSYVRSSDYRLLEAPFFRSTVTVSHGFRFRGWSYDHTGLTNVGIDDLSSMKTIYSTVLPYVRTSDAFVSSVCTSRNANLIAYSYRSSLTSGTVTVVDTVSNKIINILQYGSDAPSQVEFSPDDSRLAVMTYSGKTTIYRCADWTVERYFSFPNIDLFAASFSDNWSFLAVGNQYNSRVYNVNSNEVVADIPLGARSLAISDDGRRLALAGSHLKFYDVASMRLLPNQGFRGDRVGITADGRLIIAFSGGILADQYNGVDGSLRSSVPTWIPFIHISKFSDDGKSLFVASNESLTQVDTLTGVPKATVAFSSYPELRKSKSGDHLVGWFDGQASFSIDVFSGEGVRFVREFSDPTLKPCLDAEVCSTGDLLVTSHRESGGSVRLWNVNSGSVVWTLTNLGANPKISISPDNKSFVVCSQGHLEERDMASGILKHGFLVPAVTDGWVDYSKSGKLVSYSFGARNPSLRVFNLEDGNTWANIPNYSRIRTLPADVYVDETSNRIYANDHRIGISVYQRGVKDVFAKLAIVNDTVDMRPDLGLFSMTTNFQGEFISDYMAVAPLGP